MAFDWAQLIAPAVGAGATILGSKLQGNAANQANDRNWQIYQAEAARRNAVQSAMAPQLLAQAGYRNQNDISRVQNALGGGSGFGMQSSGLGTVPTSTPTSTASKVLGIGGALGSAGAGIGSLLGVSALGGPVGLAIGGAGALGSIVADQFGKGRRTANEFVKGVEDPFGKQQLAQVSAEAQSNPQQALQDLNSAYQNYINQVHAWQAQGGKQALVANQSLQNPLLQQTIDRLYQQLNSQRPTY